MWIDWKIRWGSPEHGIWRLYQQLWLWKNSHDVWSPTRIRSWAPTGADDSDLCSCLTKQDDCPFRLLLMLVPSDPDPEAWLSFTRNLNFSIRKKAVTKSSFFYFPQPSSHFPMLFYLFSLYKSQYFYLVYSYVYPLNVFSIYLVFSLWITPACDMCGI